MTKSYHYSIKPTSPPPPPSMPISSLIKRALVGVSAVYFGSLLILLHPWVQRHAMYMHTLQLTWGYDLTKPEHFGFASLVPLNQYQPVIVAHVMYFQRTRLRLFTYQHQMERSCLHGTFCHWACMPSTETPCLTMTLDWCKISRKLPVSGC